MNPRKREPKDVSGFTIAVILGRQEVKGDVGLEIEVEGNKFEKTNVPAPWGYHKDGSLRGKDNAEYVLNKPVAFDRVGESLDVLWNMFKAYGSVLDDSNRTSVHVHLNVQQFHMNRLTTLMAIYYAMEEILTQWCGEYRVGNLFCLRAKDAPALITRARQFIKTDGKAVFHSNIEHYAAMNTHALHKFGSLEFRTLRGCTDHKTILDWVEILERLYNLSGEISDPREVCEKFSADGPMAFFEFILGDKVSTVRNVVTWDDAKIRESMYEGIRLAQDICYCRDWDVFKPIKLKEDPFGRGLKQVANSLMNKPNPTAFYQAFGISTPQPAPTLDEYVPVYGPDYEEDDD